jgi:hypothetical protein
MAVKGNPLSFNMRDAVTCWRNLSKSKATGRNKIATTISITDLRKQLEANGISLDSKAGEPLADKGITLALHREVGSFLKFRIAEGTHDYIKDEDTAKLWKEARFSKITIPKVVEDADGIESDWD